MCRPHLYKTDSRAHCLFLYNDVYTYKMFYEYSIISAYNGVKDINYEVVQIMNSCPYDHLIRNLLKNTQHLYQTCIRKKGEVMQKLRMEKKKSYRYKAIGKKKK